MKYIRNLCRFVLLALLAGAVCGAVGTLFYHAIALATHRLAPEDDEQLQAALKLLP